MKTDQLQFKKNKKESSFVALWKTSGWISVPERPDAPLAATNAWKYANHNNIAIEPQLILCYEDFKGRHWPDIHNEGINEKEKCKDSKKNKINWLGENLDTCFLYCMFVCLSSFFFYKMVFDRNVL